MKRVTSFLVSGMIGIGIGMVWYVVETMLQTGENWQHVQVSFTSLIFWLIATFAIGAFLNLAGLVFEQTQWSLRKQIIVNFFVCYIAYFAFELVINDFFLSIKFFLVVTGAFVLMYLIAYGLYFWQLYQDVKEINQKLKEK
ncbi:DUF3021 domain-containing protein [Lactobacillus kefiranofaciens]|nr:DUF3021 domain-containing protein [Lactobacillus kefiranofaciens]